MIKQKWKKFIHFLSDFFLFTESLYAPNQFCFLIQFKARLTRIILIAYLTLFPGIKDLFYDFVLINKLPHQVNVGQELLPSLLHTARCFKIKGLDNVQTPPGLLEHNVSHYQTLSRLVYSHNYIWFCAATFFYTNFHIRRINATPSWKQKKIAPIRVECNNSFYSYFWHKLKKIWHISFKDV